MAVGIRREGILKQWLISQNWRDSCNRLFPCLTDLHVGMNAPADFDGNVRHHSPEVVKSNITTAMKMATNASITRNTVLGSDKETADAEADEFIAATNILEIGL